MRKTVPPDTIALPMRSTRLTLAETRKAMRLLASARDLRHHPAERGAVIVDGLCKLFGATNGFHIEIEDYRPGGKLQTRSMIYGSVFDPIFDKFMHGRLGYERTLNDDAMVAHSIGRRARTTVLTHQILLPKLDLKQFSIYADVTKLYGMHDSLALIARPGKTQDLVAYAIHRRESTKAFTPAQRALAKLITAELRRDYDLDLPPSPYHGLPVRTGQVLERLLRGHSPKRIAEEFRRSLHTIRDHVQALLHHFEVGTVHELMAKLLRKKPEERLATDDHG